MIEIDGSMHSGSGTILRYAVALATLKRESLHITHIRNKRPKPGLRRQHLQAVEAACAISGGHAEGAEVGSQEILFTPGRTIPGGEFRFDIGSAGSATMAAFTLIPPCLFASSASKITIAGGLFQDFAPSFFHMQRVLLPLLRKMGADLNLRMLRPGYVPDGQGQLEMTVKPARSPLKPLNMVDRGSVEAVNGIALSSHLTEQMVSRRMARRALNLLRDQGFQAKIDEMNDSSAVQRGAALVLWAQTDTGCILGADQAGKRGRKSESIADFVAKSLMQDLDSSATTDRHLADQLIMFAALADGTTRYTIPITTDHVESNLWLVDTILGAKADLDGNLLSIHGMAFESPDTCGCSVKCL
ncbi:MAG: RNA 3'-phosphate cyclase [Desulfomonile tiedjei]|uniref:RNA 3'-terminal phosphate cyclase n=1 Tax=Desulfomonile tiedjei TaxID=2358 RepID=A0A9D6UZZ1_9BACT|nr:RNA 3'-phosphate cyclase [Desulfomonile tiedjei]